MKRLTTHIFCLLAGVFFFSFSEVAAVTLTASVDRNPVTPEDQVAYTLTVEGTRDADPPNLPDLSEFHVRQGGSSTQVSIINGAMSQNVKYSYYLLPKKTGKLLIGAASLPYQGQTIKSQPIELIVSEPVSGKMSQEKSKDEREESSKAVFARALISKKEPFENEQIIYTFRLFRKADIANANLDLPSFSDFWVEDLGKQKEFRQVINGITYHVTEIKKALFPLKTGSIKVESASLQCDVVVADNTRRRDPFGNFLNDPFFGQFMGRNRYVKKFIRSNDLEIHVRPLPQEGKPENFEKLVGNFSIVATMENEELEVGGTNTVTAIVEGDGNIRDAELFFQSDTKNFKVYDDKPEVKIDTNGSKVIGRKTFKKAFVPLREGRFSLSKIQLAYFNPEKEKYEILSTSLAPMKVLKSTEKESLKLVGDTEAPPQKTRINIIGKDIFPIITNENSLEKSNLEKIYLGLATVFFLLPSILFISTFVTFRRKERRLSRTDLYRFKTAFPSASKRFKALRLSSEAGNGQSFYSELSKLIKEYIGDKTNVPGGSLTPFEVDELLEKKGVSEKTKKSVLHFLEKCESEQFAPRSDTDINLESIKSRAENLVKELEKEINYKP